MYYALVTGLLIGWWLAKRHIDHLLVVYYHFRFREPKRYLQLYDAQDGELSFEMMRGQKDPPKNYAQYLLWHQKCRPKAGKTFRIYWDALIRELIRDYLLFMVVPAVLFMSSWLYFLFPIFLLHLGYFIHRHFVKQNRLGFYSILVQTLVINDIRKQKT